MPITREGDTLLVEGTIDHGIYPVRHEEIDQTVVLRGPYTVRGGIYARQLRAAGAGVVHGPAVTREDLLLDQRHLAGAACHEFRSGLTSPTIIRNDGRPFRVLDSAVMDLANARLRVKGPVIADTVHLTNAVVIGNIHARVATLHGCVVFGVVECRDQLLMNSCNFVAYRAGRARLLGRLSTWLGYGVSMDAAEFAAGGRPHLEPGEDADGPVPADLRYLPICLSRTACRQEDDFETCGLYHTGECPACVSGRTLVPQASLTAVDFQLRVLERRSHGQAPDVAPPVAIRTSAGESPERVGPLDELPGLLASGVEPARLELRHGDAWLPFHEHPAFQARYRFARVLSVAGRMLDARPVREAIDTVTRLGRTLAHFDLLDADAAAAIQPPPVASTRKLFDLGTAAVDIAHEPA